jgi:hypothetical protein
MERLMKYDNTGDSHIRLLLKYPDKYQVQNGLVKLFLEAFYSILWDKSNPLNQKLEVAVKKFSSKEEMLALTAGCFGWHSAA